MSFCKRISTEFRRFCNWVIKKEVSAQCLWTASRQLIIYMECSQGPAAILRMGRQANSFYLSSRHSQDKEAWMWLTLRQTVQTSSRQTNTKVTWAYSHISITLPPFLSFDDKFKYVQYSENLLQKCQFTKIQNTSSSVHSMKCMKAASSQ